MQINRVSKIKNLILVSLSALLISFIVHSNLFTVAKAVFKDIARGNQYERAEKVLSAEQRINETGGAEFVISGVTDYVQMLHLTLQQPTAEHIVVQVYGATGEGGQQLTHIGDILFFPEQQEGQMEIHQFIDGLVIRQVSPDSGVVDDIHIIPVDKAVINSNYMTTSTYIVNGLVSYYQQQGFAGAKKIITTFLLIVLCYILLKIRIPATFDKRLIYGGIGILDIIMGAVFAKIALQYSEFIAYRNSIICIGVLCILAVTFTAFFLFIRKTAIHRVYGFAGLMMGLVFMIALPVYQVPDEPTHLYAAYDLSNWVMGQGMAEDGEIAMRKSDYEMPVQTGQFTPQDYERYYSSFFEKSHCNTLVDTDCLAAQTWHYQYVMGALGITIGRLLGWGAVPTFMLGRFLSLLLFVTMVSYAIKKLPVGKMVMFTLALLPMTVQQSMSFSYDTVLIPVIFVTVSLSVRLAYCDDGEMNKGDYILLAVCAMACMPAKGHAYFLAGFLPILALLKKGNLSKTKRQRVWIILALALLSLVATTLLQNIIFPNLKEMPEGYVNYIEWADAEGYTIGGLLSQPVLLLKIVFRTITGYGPYYLETFLGNRLGWLEIYISNIGLQLLFFILVIACIPRKENTVQFSKSTRAVLWLVGILEIMFIFAGFLLAWTPVSEGAIAGVQGRYFIPAIVTILISFQGRWAKISENVDRPLGFALVATLCWVTVNVVSWI